MVHSVKQSYGVVVLAVSLAAVICGCTSTQTTAARLQLNDSRLRATSEPVHVKVGETSASVAVGSDTFLVKGAAFEVAVTLENHTDQAVSDLPISVGYQLGSHTVYLNGATGLAYFENHIPAIPAHGSLTWVDHGVKRLPRGARTFARVGPTPEIALGRFTPPVIRVASAVTAAPSAQPNASNRLAKSAILTVSLTNTSSIPQYELPVYAVATREGRIVAASDGSIMDLAAGERAVIHVSGLVTAVTGGSDHIRVEAPATIFK